MPNPSHHNQDKTPGDIHNILQGDDSHPTLNNSLNKTPYGTTMDGRNMGDHDSRGRFNPFGDLPEISPRDPSFVRQLGPIMGGKHIGDEEGTFRYINNDDDNDITLNTIQHSAPVLGTKRQDEPDQDQIGLDPSQGKMKID